MAENDVARLIMEIEALRAELRAAISSGGGVPGQGQLGSNPSSTFSPAANALAMHQMTAKGFVSNLTGSRSPQFNLALAFASEAERRGLEESMLQTYLSGRPVNPKSIQISNAENIRRQMLDHYENPANTANYRYKPPMAYKQAAAFAHRGPDFVRNYLEKTEARQEINMAKHAASAAEIRNTGGKTFVGKLWKRTTGRYGKAAGVIGGIMGAAEALQAWDTGDDRDDRRFLTNAEERSGMTHVDRFGAHKSWLGELAGGANSALGSALTWTAMSTYTERMRTDTAMQAGKSAFRQVGRSATGFHRPFNILKASGFAIKGTGFIAAGLLRSAANPATVALTGWKLLDEIFSDDSSYNTWDKKNKESNKKLKSQLDELNSYDSFTAQQKIDAALTERGAKQGMIGTGIRGGLSLLGIMDTPAQREEKIRAKLSDDFSQAAKIAEESAKEARLGNIKEAEKSIKKARKMAGDLVPVDWQDPMRIYTQQETASRSKACFARYLNNRVTNRAGD